ncbi:cytochrome C nitrite reductase [Sphingomonas sp. 28-62-20]|uniref:cytochrome C nitrite reductase n=1 Tax=Sphingomonas sp. 28-62-20 TaxID=1970433 RepID=UPI0026C503F6
MTRTALLLPFAVLIGSCGQSAPTERKLSVPADFAFRSASITLPDDATSLPAGAAIVTQNCTGCHSAEMITVQPPLDAAKWQAEIDKMRGVFKAPIDPADDPRLIAALTALAPSVGADPGADRGEAGTDERGRP